MSTDFLDRLEAAARSGLPANGIRAEDLNALGRLILRGRHRSFRLKARKPSQFPHPWRVTSRRPDIGGLDAGRAWRFDIEPGAINDACPAIPYRRKGDPRGWKGPSTGAAIVDRELIDDPTDPPWLLAMAPSARAKTADDFTLRPKSTWPDYFAYEADDELKDAELWRAHVVLSALPLRSAALDPLLPAPALRRFRLYVTRRLPAIAAADAGGWVELATLWLLRTDRTQPDADQMHVEPKEFWPLWSAIVQPGADLVSSLDEITKDVGQGGVNQLLADLVRDDVAEDLVGAAFVSFWTV